MHRTTFAQTGPVLLALVEVDISVIGFSVGGYLLPLINFYKYIPTSDQLT